MRYSLFFDVTQRRLIVTDVSGQPSAPFSSAKQSKENAGNTYVHSYIGNGMSGDWFSKNTTLANRVDGACRTWKGEEEQGTLFAQQKYK
jgi:hypothetical protein